MVVFAGVRPIDCKLAAVKLAVALALFIVTGIDAGVNTTPSLLGVTVYEPLSRFGSE
jgi:hypothetical protein